MNGVKMLEAQLTLVNNKCLYEKEKKNSLLNEEYYS